MDEVKKLVSIQLNGISFVNESVDQNNFKKYPYPLTAVLSSMELQLHADEAIVKSTDNNVERTYKLRNVTLNLSAAINESFISLIPTTYKEPNT